MDKCNWCEPGHEICGTCEKFFDYFGDGYDRCSADLHHELCVGYDPIDFCPKCGRKLRKKDGN